MLFGTTFDQLHAVRQCRAKETSDDQSVTISTQSAQTHSVM